MREECGPPKLGGLRQPLAGHGVCKEKESSICDLPIHMGCESQVMDFILIVFMKLLEKRKALPNGLY